MCTLKVLLSHPYIGAENASDFREMRHQLRMSLEMAWTVEMRSRHALVRYSTYGFAFSSTVSGLVCLGIWLCPQIIIAFMT